ncbi:MAG: nuclear transport factor 2 family protein [Candidatus Bathyarchaeota archaeon]|nr:nuclear transport factor 2 family protein [Candidatus Bathyarchaeota archaeon]
MGIWMEIEEAVNEWVKIWNNYNLNRVKELFLIDERVTYFSSEKQGLIKGIDNLVAHHKEFGFIEGGKDIGNTLWLEDVSIEEFSDTAVVKADWLFQRKGSDLTQKGPVTLVFVKVNGKPKIAHAHFSNY